jgi:hypothetical protein
VRSAEPNSDRIRSLTSWQQQLVTTGERLIKHALDISSLWRSCGRADIVSPVRSSKNPKRLNQPRASEAGLIKNSYYRLIAVEHPGMA